MTVETFVDEVQRIPQVVRANAALHIEPVTDDHRIFRIVWLASIIRGAGRATMTACQHRWRRRGSLHA